MTLSIIGTYEYEYLQSEVGIDKYKILMASQSIRQNGELLDQQTTVQYEMAIEQIADGGKVAVLMNPANMNLYYCTNEGNRTF